MTPRAVSPAVVVRWLMAHRALAAFGLSYYAVLLAVGVASGNGQVPIYAGFMAVLFAAVIATDRMVGFSGAVLWGLAVWGLLHMCGGLVPAGHGRVLYEVWLLPVLRFDHVVHAVGFGFAAVACWQAAQRVSGGAFSGWRALPVVVLGGTGLGALNEMVEFLITRLVAGTNVGGFENTGWDLVANLAGSLVAAVAVARTAGRGSGTATDGLGCVPVSTVFVLASASPARRAVLRAAGVEPQIMVSDVDEDAIAAGLVNPDPDEVVVALAAAKAADVAAKIAGRHRDAVVVGCDSMLLIDGELVGKPGDTGTARSRWRRMAGGTGELLTGHAVVRLAGGEGHRTAEGVASTTIRFGTPDDAELEAYIGTGEPLSVAGAFTIDGLGGWFVDGVDGDPSSVVGLSLPLTRRLLADVGVSVVTLWSASSADTPV